MIDAHSTFVSSSEVMAIDESNVPLEVTHFVRGGLSLSHLRAFFALSVNVLV